MPLSTIHTKALKTKNRLMKYTLLFALTFILSFHAQSQFIMPGEKEAASFKDRKLIVQLRSFENDDKKLKKKIFKERISKNPEDIANYKEYLENVNESIKSAFNNYWNMHQEIEYLNEDEIEDFLTKKDPKSYGIIKLELDRDYRPEPGSKVEIDGYRLSAFLAEKKSSFFSCMVPNDGLSPFEFNFLLSNIQKYINAASDGLSRKDKSLWDYERNLSIMKNNSLTLPKSALAIEEAEAKSFYKFPLNFTSDEEIISMYVEKPEGVLLPGMIFHSKKKVWMYVIIHPAKMDIVSLIPVNSGINFSVRTLMPGYSRNDAYAKAIELISLKSSSGFGKQQFKGIAHKLAFKLNY